MRGRASGDACGWQGRSGAKLCVGCLLHMWLGCQGHVLLYPANMTVMLPHAAELKPTWLTLDRVQRRHIRCVDAQSVPKAIWPVDRVTRMANMEVLATWACSWCQMNCSCEHREQ